MQYTQKFWMIIRLHIPDTSKYYPIVSRRIQLAKDNQDALTHYQCKQDLKLIKHVKHFEPDNVKQVMRHNCNILHKLLKHQYVAKEYQPNQYNNDTAGKIASWTQQGPNDSNDVLSYIIPTGALTGLISVIGYITIGILLHFHLMNENGMPAKIIIGVLITCFAIYALCMLSLIVGDMIDTAKGR